MKPIPPSDPDLDIPPLQPACAATQEALVEGIPESTEIAEHLKGCADCRVFRAFLPILREGLSNYPPAIPAEGAIAQVLSASLRDRRSRIRRQIVKAGVGLAMAASILIAVVTILPPKQPTREIVQQHPPAKVEVVSPTPPAHLESTLPPIRDTILEARSTVVTNLQRSADETVASTLSWLPPMVVPNPDPLEPLEPAVNSLSEVGHEAAACVQPLTDTAKRAVGLFWKELPSID